MDISEFLQNNTKYSNKKVYTQYILYLKTVSVSYKNIRRHLSIKWLVWEHILKINPPRFFDIYLETSKYTSNIL